MKRSGKVFESLHRNVTRKDRRVETGSFKQWLLITVRGHLHCLTLNVNAIDELCYEMHFELEEGEPSVREHTRCYVRFNRNHSKFGVERKFNRSGIVRCYPLRGTRADAMKWLHQEGGKIIHPLEDWGERVDVMYSMSFNLEWNVYSCTE